ncbi:MAG: hypothetical protein ACK41U_00080 [Paracoccus sp. (in: a-proteobacteria)]|uniref:hypothetical protein n=1 Tax=Paracoccus sp. TaxID=267 RepID=UPI003918800E
MSKTSSPSVQPVAKAASHAPETPNDKAHEDVLMDAMGFETRVEFILDGRAQSVRNRLPPGTDRFTDTRQKLESLLGKGGTVPSSVGNIARDALKYLVAAEKNLAQLPKEYQEIGRRILNSAWQAGAHGTEASLRDNGLKNARSGQESSNGGKRGRHGNARKRRRLCAVENRILNKVAKKLEEERRLAGHITLVETLPHVNLTELVQEILIEEKDKRPHNEINNLTARTRRAVRNDSISDFLGDT